MLQLPPTEVHSGRLKLVFQVDVPAEHTAGLVVDVGSVGGDIPFQPGKRDANFETADNGHVACVDADLNAVYDGNMKTQLKYTLRSREASDPQGERIVDLKPLIQLERGRNWLCRVEDQWATDRTQVQALPFGRGSKSMSVCASNISCDGSEVDSFVGDGTR